MQMPDWATEIQERKQELQDLQSQTGTNDHHIYSADFPTTYADLSFSERLENAATGYEPFKDMKAYREMKIEDQETYLSRINSSANTGTNTQTSINREKIMAKIAAVLKDAQK